MSFGFFKDQNYVKHKPIFKVNDACSCCFYITLATHMLPHVIPTATTTFSEFIQIEMSNT